MEEEIVALRKELTELCVDAGAHTIAYHPQCRHRRSPKAVHHLAGAVPVGTHRGPTLQATQKLLAAFPSRVAFRASVAVWR